MNNIAAKYENYTVNRGKIKARAHSVVSIIFVLVFYCLKTYTARPTREPGMLFYI